MEIRYLSISDFMTEDIYHKKDEMHPIQYGPWCETKLPS